MKFWVVASIAGISLGLAAANPDIVQDFYEQLYPSDPAKRHALELCFLADHQFNRLDRSQREACYRGRSALVTDVAPDVDGAKPPTSNAAANVIDLWRSSGQGNLPQNDIRFQEQNTRYVNAGQSR
jgi:hypothetical protein